jgi:hypothetical protein
MPLDPGVVLLVLLGLVLLGLVLDEVSVLLVPLVVELELDVLPWADAPPWPLTLRSCHGTGTSLLSAEMTAKSMRPLVGLRITSSMRPTSSPELLLTCAPITLVLRKCCC